jgi:drug/metabolite transporter (DMT)-like permease
MKSSALTISLPGVSYALAAALLFGASTPVSKVLLDQVDPILLAGLLYFGSGSGLALWWWLRLWFQGRRPQEARLTRADFPCLAGAILAGGVVGPMFLMAGLAVTPASSASLLLNLEGVFTAVLAWLVFAEPFDHRIMLGMAAITAGGLLLSWAGRPELGVPWGAIAIVSACLAWGVDNNLTRKVSAGRSCPDCRGEGPHCWRGELNLRPCDWRNDAGVSHRHAVCGGRSARIWGQS